MMLGKTYRIVATLAAIILLTGCTDWTGSRAAPAYFPAPGQYAQPAQPTPRLRVGVPPLAIDDPVGTAPDVDVQAAASDELFGLLDSSARFDLVERQHLQKVLAEQNLSDMIQPGRLVHPAPVDTFDYVLLGRIKELSIRRESEPGKMSVAGMQRAMNIGQGWIPKLVTDAKVEMMLVNVHTGGVEVAGTSEFHHLNLPKELGLQLTSDQLMNSPQIRLTPADTHHLLQLILDDALRPMLPRVDRWAAALPSAKGDPLTGNATLNPPGAVNPLAGTQPAVRPAAPALTATSICPECGTRVAKNQEFCPNCGHKLK